MKKILVILISCTITVISFFLLLPALPLVDDAAPITPLKIVVADVGHGDCIWIRTPDDGIDGNGKCEGYNILIDGGPSSNRIMDIMLPLGLRYGTTIDWLVNTHAHNDHYRGLIGILEAYRVKQILDPGFLHTGQAYSAFCWKALIESGATFYSPVIGIATIPGLKALAQSVPCPLDWGDELKAEILYSNPSVTQQDVNNSSIVIRLEYGLFSMLFTGDAEGKFYKTDSPEHSMAVEKFLLDHYVTEDKSALESTIIKVGHHGSETSSTSPFIKAVSPKEGIICAGNRHGLPDESVIKRYEDLGCRIWRTDRLDVGKSGSECHGDDSIIITSNGIDYDISYKNEDPLDPEVLAAEIRARKKEGEASAEVPINEEDNSPSDSDPSALLNTLD